MNEKIKEIMEKADGISRACFAEYKISKARYESAKSKLDNLTKNTPEYIRQSLIVDDAKLSLSEKEKAFYSKYEELKRLRKDLESAIDESELASAKDLDKDTIYLLESGILTPREYEKLYNGANNNTMRRIIKKHIDQAGDEYIKAHGDDKTSMEYRILQTNTFESDKIGDYDVLLSVFERSINNKAMIDHWDEFVTIDGE